MQVVITTVIGIGQSKPEMPPLTIEQMRLATGAIVQRQSDVSMTKNKVIVRLNSFEFLDVPRNLDVIYENLLDAENTVKSYQEELKKDITDVAMVNARDQAIAVCKRLENRAMSARDKILPLLSQFSYMSPGKTKNVTEGNTHTSPITSNRRTKRLAPLAVLAGGLLALSGVAGLGLAVYNHFEIDRLNSEMVEMTDRVSTIELDIGDISTKMNEILDKVNILNNRNLQGVSMIELAFSVMTIQSSLDVIENDIEILNNNIKSTVNSIILAAKGFVNHNLFTTDQLIQLISDYKAKGITPVYSEKELLLYYTIMSVYLTPYEILIEIPFDMQDQFERYDIIPFPTQAHSNKTLILDSSPVSVLIGKSRRIFSVTPTSELVRMCSLTKLLATCNVQNFIQHTSFPGLSCHFDLISSMEFRVPQGE